MSKEQPFTPLELPVKHLLDVGNSLYMVYSDRKKFVQVEAPNAQAAIIASGVARPLKVLKQDLAACTIISLNGKCNNGIDLNRPLKTEESQAAANDASDSEASPTAEAASGQAAAPEGADAASADEAQAQPAAEASETETAEEAEPAAQEATEQAAPPADDTAQEQPTS